MKASEWIDQVKIALDLPSDYAAAKVLNITRSAVSKYRSRESTLDEDTALRVAEVLKINPARVVLDQLAERTKSALLRSEVERLCILCKVTVAAIARLANPAAMRPAA